jgi:hypothetical protein
MSAESDFVNGLLVAYKLGIWSSPEPKVEHLHHFLMSVFQFPMIIIAESMPLVRKIHATHQALDSMLVNRTHNFRGRSAVNNGDALCPFILAGPMGSGKSEVFTRLVAERAYSVRAVIRVNTAAKTATDDGASARTPEELQSCVDQIALAFGIRSSRSLFHRALISEFFVLLPGFYHAHLITLTIFR